MLFYFVRHGQTDWNQEGRIQGSHDLPLNDDGRSQAKKLCQSFNEKKITFDRIFTSPLARAKETAAIIGEAFQKKVFTAASLKEMNFGFFEGKTFHEAHSQHLEVWKEFLSNAPYEPIPEGESMNDVIHRVLDLITLLAQQDQSYVMVTHGAVLSCLYCYFQKVPYSKWEEHILPNSEIMILEFIDDNFYMRQYGQEKTE